MKALLLIIVTTTLAHAETNWTSECNAGKADACQIHGSQLEQAGHVEEAVMFYDKACTLGLQAACFQFAIHLKDGQGIKADPKRAYTMLVAQCEGPQPAACGIVAQMLRTGVGTTANAARAAEYQARMDATMKTQLDAGTAAMRKMVKTNPDFFRKAEANCRKGTGSIAAMDCVNATYVYDQTAPNKALELLHQACKIEPSGCATYGMLLEQRGFNDLALQLFSEECDRDNHMACFEQAARTKDEAAALALYDKACTLGSPDGCTKLEKINKDPAAKKRAAAAREKWRKDKLASDIAKCDAGSVAECHGVIALAAKSSPEHKRAKLAIEADDARRKAAAQDELDAQAAVVPWIQRLAQLAEESRAQTDERIPGDRLPLADMQHLNPELTQADYDAAQEWVKRRKARLAEIKQLLGEIKPLLK